MAYRGEELKTKETGGGSVGHRSTLPLHGVQVPWEEMPTSFQGEMEGAWERDSSSEGGR